MLNKVNFIQTVAKMLEEVEFSKSVFFVYSDGVNWGVEIYNVERPDLDEPKVASMWWNIAMKNVYNLTPLLSSNLDFSFTFYNAQDDVSPIDKIEVMDQLFKARLENTSLYQSLISD